MGFHVEFTGFNGDILRISWDVSSCNQTWIAGKSSIYFEDFPSYNLDVVREIPSLLCVIVGGYYVTLRCHKLQVWWNMAGKSLIKVEGQFMELNVGLFDLHFWWILIYTTVFLIKMCILAGHTLGAESFLHRGFSLNLRRVAPCEAIPSSS